MVLTTRDLFSGNFFKNRAKDSISNLASCGYSPFERRLIAFSRRHLVSGYLDFTRSVINLISSGLQTQKLNPVSVNNSTTDTDFFVCVFVWGSQDITDFC